MSDYELTPRSDAVSAEVHGGGAAALPYVEVARPPLSDYGDVGEEGGGGRDLRRYLHALLRRKWWVVVSAVVGLAGGAAVWRTTEVEYTAVGSLWLENQAASSGSGDVTPIRASGLLQASSWIELLRSFTVLDSVVIAERLYLEAPDAHEGAFASLELGENFRPGSYRL